MKKLIPILLAVFALVSCEKDPDMDKLLTAFEPLRLVCEPFCVAVSASRILYRI